MSRWTSPADRARRAENQRAYRARNPEKCRARKKAYYEKHREEILAKEKKRYEGQRQLKIWQSAEQRVTRLGTQAELTREEWAHVLAFYEGHCAYCGQPGSTLDHVHPLSRGGGHCLGNAAPACKSCNSTKRHRPIGEWLRLCAERLGQDAETYASAFVARLEGATLAWQAQAELAEFQQMIAAGQIGPPLDWEEEQNAA